MAIEKVKLMHECSPVHLRMGTARLKYDEKTGEKVREEKIKVEANCAKSLKLVQSRKSLTTVSRETHSRI